MLATPTPGLAIVSQRMRERQGRALGYYLAAASLGYAIGLLIASAMIPLAGWRGAFVVTACCHDVGKVGLLKFADRTRRPGLNRSGVGDQNAVRVTFAIHRDGGGRAGIDHVDAFGAVCMQFHGLNSSFPSFRLQWSLF